MSPETSYDVKDPALSEQTSSEPSQPPTPQYEDKFPKLENLVSETTPTAPPITPSTSIKPSVIITTTTTTPSSPKRRRKIKPWGDGDIYFGVKWACGILTVAASIVFGIWAPLSYEATVSDNETQNAMLGVLSSAQELAATANVIASRALDTASGQRGALESTIGLMGRLAVLEFCYGQQTLSVCSSYIRGADGELEDLIRRLGYRTVVSTATESARSPVTTTATVSPKDRGVGDVPDATASPPPIPANMAASDPSAAAPAKQRPASQSVQSKARATSTTTSTSTLIPTATTPAVLQPSKKVARLPVDAVFGIVFGVIGFGGAGLGFVVWRMRRRRLMLLEE